MERAYEILSELITKNKDTFARNSDIEELENLLISRILDQSWMPSTNSEWLHNLSHITVRRVIEKLQQQRERGTDKKTLEKDLSTYAANLETEIFFVPDVINMIYSPGENHPELFVNKGVDIHCQFIRRAIASLLRRYSGGLRELSLEHSELEEELWGNVLEEIIRCMTDMSARVWNPKQTEPLIFPPVKTRGTRKGYISRVSLSASGDRLATFRSDSTLSVWDVPNSELLHSWDIGYLSEKEDFCPAGLYFSSSGDEIAMEVEPAEIAVFPIGAYDKQIRYYNEKKRKQFFHEFGTPFVLNLDKVDQKEYQVRMRAGERIPLKIYENLIYGWSCDESGMIVATASEIKRMMPDWMIAAGFERAVFHIAKKRLIDLIRKHSHAGYACWRCGAISSSSMEAYCHQCGWDFSKCPLGCPVPPAEPLAASNHWQCSHCGLSSRTIESQTEIRGEEFFSDTSTAQQDWQNRHDLERILDSLRNVSVAYKNKDITCDRLVSLKAQGKTNEEIGQALEIPKGSVDYVWNQCRKKVIQTIPDIE